MKYYFKVICVVLFCIVGLSCKQEQNLETSVKPMALSIAIQDNCVSSLVLLAKARGYFRENNLDVTIVPCPSGKIALQNMLKGKVDVADSADIPIMKACFKYFDLRIIGTIATTSNSAWILARKDHQVIELKDLKGKRIATQKKSAVHYFMSMFLMINGIPEDKCQIVCMPAKSGKIPNYYSFITTDLLKDISKEKITIIGE